MPKKFTQFFLGLVIITAVIVALAYWLFTGALAQYYIPVYPWLLAFYVLISAAVHFFHLKAKDANSKKYPRYSIAVNGGKIFLYMLFIVVYVFLERATAVPFLFGFFILYMIYSGYETVMLYKSK